MDKIIIISYAGAGHCNSPSNTKKQLCRCRALSCTRLTGNVIKVQPMSKESSMQAQLFSVCQRPHTPIVELARSTVHDLASHSSAVATNLMAIKPGITRLSFSVMKSTMMEPVLPSCSRLKNSQTSMCVHFDRASLA